MEELYKKYRECGCRVTTDSRVCPEGSLFIALRGENFDGNKFAASALEKGCRYALVDRPEYAEDKRYILTDNTLITLQRLARRHRQQFHGPVIAITGTNGKTTTKELLHAVLSQKYKVLATKGNLNNHIGVPLTLLSIRDDHQLAIIEMGASHPGDIEELVNIAQPDSGLITNVGMAHLQGFGSFEGVVRTKTELYKYLKGRVGSRVFVNSDSRELMDASENMNRTIYGRGVGHFVSGEIISCDPLLEFEWRHNRQSYKVCSQLVGAYNIDNALAAAAVGLSFGVSEKDINTALEEYTPGNNRSQLVRTRRNTLIIDAYNANPTSMTAAIDNFRLMKGDKKLAILGDMRELGTESLEAHKKIISRIKEAKIDNVILVGEEFRRAGGEFRHVDNVEQLAPLLKNIAGALVLIKGSNGMKLWKAADAL